MAFEADEGIRWVHLVVVRATDDALFPGLVELVRNCKAETDVSTVGSSGAVFADTVAVKETSGPEIGEKSVWFATSVTTQVAAPGLPEDMRGSGVDDDPSLGVIFREGDYVVQLRADGSTSQAELEELARTAIAD